MVVLLNLNDMQKNKNQLKKNVRVSLDGRDKRPGIKTSTTLKIKNEEAYEVTMKEIDFLAKKGEENLTAAELDRLRVLTEAAENFEDEHHPLPVPSSLPDMIRVKMFQLRFNQQFTAKLLGVSEAKFSMIMNGKQKPDIYFIKAIHSKLNLDGNQILEAI